MTEDEDFECASVLSSHTQDVKHVTWHPNKEILASCSYDNTIKLFKEEIDDWTCFATLESHESTVWKICFDSSGSRLVSASDDRTLKIWQEYLPGNSEGVSTIGSDATWKCVCTLSGYHNRTIFDVDWSHIDGRIVTASGDDCIRVFKESEASDRNQPSFSLTATARKAHSQDVNSVSWNPKIQGLLTSCSDDGEVKLWNYKEITDWFWFWIKQSTYNANCRCFSFSTHLCQASPKRNQTKIRHPKCSIWSWSTVCIQDKKMKMYIRHPLNEKWTWLICKDRCGVSTRCVNLETEICASSWDYGTFINSSNAHAQPSSGAKCLIFGRTLCLLPYIMCANSEGSGETAGMHRLAWAYTGGLYDKYHNLMSWLICCFWPFHFCEHNSQSQ